MYQRRYEIWYRALRLADDVTADLEIVKRADI